MLILQYLKGIVPMFGTISSRWNERGISKSITTLFFCGSGMTVGVHLAGRRKWGNRK